METNIKNLIHFISDIQVIFMHVSMKTILQCHPAFPVLSTKMFLHTDVWFHNCFNEMGSLNEHHWVCAKLLRLITITKDKALIFPEVFFCSGTLWQIYSFAYFWNVWLCGELESHFLLVLQSKDHTLIYTNSNLQNFTSQCFGSQFIWEGFPDTHSDQSQIITVPDSFYVMTPNILSMCIP